MEMPIPKRDQEGSNALAFGVDPRWRSNLETEGMTEYQLGRTEPLWHDLFSPPAAPVPHQAMRKMRHVSS
jgi:hypothetical protein